MLLLCRQALHFRRDENWFEQLMEASALGLCSARILRRWGVAAGEPFGTLGFGAMQMLAETVHGPDDQARLHQFLEIETLGGG